MPTGNTSIIRSASAAVLTAGFLLTSGGCLITSGKSVEESGVAVGTATLGQVEAGKTTQAWLIATLGTPTTITEVDGQPNVKVLRYDHVVTRRESGSVFLIFGGASKTRKVTHAYFEVQDGVVVRHWSEPQA